MAKKSTFLEMHDAVGGSHSSQERVQQERERQKKQEKKTAQLRQEAQSRNSSTFLKMHNAVGGTYGGKSRNPWNVKKATSKANTASGLTPEAAEKMREQREAYQAQLDAFDYDTLNQRLDAVTRNRTPDVYSRDPEYQKIMGMFQEEEALKEKIADADVQLNLYDNIDGFQTTRVDPLKKKEGFSTSRETWNKNATDKIVTGDSRVSQRMAEKQEGKDSELSTLTEQRNAAQADLDAQIAEKEAEELPGEKDTYLTLLTEDIDALTRNRTADEYGRDPEYQAALSAYEQVDEAYALGEYLDWYNGLDEDTRERLLEGRLNAQDPRNREIVQSTPSTVGKHWERMTDDEINAYYYIANTEGAQAAHDFLEDLQVTLDKRHTEGREQATIEQMEESPTWANTIRGVATVGANIIGGPMAFASDAIRTAEGKDFNPYSNAHYLQNITGVTRSAAANDIQQTVAGDGKSAFWNGVGELAANAYQSALSSLDSVAGMYTMGKWYTVSMGMGAASSRMRELYESGATDGEIYAGAIGSGFIEAFFEKFSLDALAEDFIKANPEKWVKKLAAQAGVEGSEEFFTEIANLVLDSINRGINSDHNQRVRELMGNAENPMGREEAEHQATKEDAMDVFWAFLGGVMSGGMSSVSGAVMDASRQNQSGQDILARNVQEQIIAEGQELRQGDKLAQSLETKQKEGTLGKNEGIFSGIKDSRDATRLGRLLEQNVADMTSKDRSAVKSAVTARLTDEGTHILDKEGTAEAIVKSLSGEGLGVYDRFLLASNEKVADKVRNEVYSAADGTTANNAWVKRIETYGHTTGTTLKETAVEKAGREAMETTVKEEFGQHAETVMKLYNINRGLQNRMDFVAEAKEVYQAGMDGVPLDQAPKTTTLTEFQREAVWDMGQGKSDYDYDNNQGFATIKGETTPVNIVAVESTDGGTLTLRTDDGQVVSAKDVTFGSYSQSKLYSVISAMGVDTETANEIVTMSNETGLDLNVFSRAMQDAFFAGRNGIPFADIPKDRYAMKLTEEQRKVAWKAGRAAARERAVQKGKRVQQGKHGRAKGGVKMEASARNIRNLNAQQQAGMNAANVLGALGLDITVYASTEEQRAKGMENGYIQLSDGSIHIDLNSGDSGEGVMAWALSHEFTHFVEEMSPEKFQSFQDVLFQELGQSNQDVMELIESKVAELSSQEQYSDLSEERLWEIATSEVVAEMMEPMLTDTDAIARISDNLRQQDKGLWEKIKDWLSGLVEKLKKAYKDLTPGSAIARQTREVVTQSEQILNAWVDVATDAIVNYNLQDGQKNNTPGGVQQSSRNTRYDYSKTFLEQVEDYKKGLIPKGDTLIVSETPKVFRGIGMNALPVTINTSHVDYALNGTKDFDHHLGESLLKQLPDAIKSPVAIMTSGTKSGSSVVAMLEIRHNGKQVIVPVAIDGFGKQNGVIIDSNAITSVYGKNYSISKVLHDAIEQEANGQFRLFYLNENKATKLLQEARVPMPKNPATNNGGYIHSLTDTASPVKLKFGDVTESQQFKRWFGDWQNDPANASKVVNADGTPKVVYHQTGGLFTVFDTRREGAGSRDEGTPFGIFLKSSDRDIGLSGKFQMGLYADIKNPLRANNRDDLRYKIIQMSDAYETLIAEHNRIDSEYKAKVDNSIKELREFMLEWRKENPNASRTALYDVPRFNELFEAEDHITDEWAKKIADVSAKAKAAMTEALEKNGYDGVFLTEDAGSFGRKTDAYIALHPEQVKSATDNVGTFDAGNPDIRFSQRSAAQLERENEKLRQDKEYLKELVKIQRQGNKDFVPTRASVNSMAEALKKQNGVRGNTAELAALLDDFYRYIGKGNLDAAEMDRLVGKAADWIQEHQQAKRDPYAQEVLDWMKKRHVSLSQTQVDEIKYQYGSLREYQSAIKGSIIIDQNANTSLNQLWQEGNNQYADQFGSDVTEGDMPGAFADMVERLRNSEDTDTAERRYRKEEFHRDLMDQVYDTYFSVKPVESVSDTMQEKINSLLAEKANADRTNKQLERQNEQLRQEKEYLKELIKIQRQGNIDRVPKRSSVYAMAEKLKSETKAIGSTKELAGLLDDFYRYIGKGNENVDTSDRLSREVVSWIKEHQGVGDAAYELIAKVWDTYYEVVPVDSISDTMQRKINQLKEEKNTARKQYREDMAEANAEVQKQKEENRATLKAMQGIRKVALESYRKQQSASDQRMKQLYEQQYRLVMEDYQKQLTEAGSEKTSAKVESWRKTEERGKLYRNLSALNRMMLNPTKTAFVPDSLQPAVIHAMEVFNDYRLSEKPDMARIQSLRNELDRLTLEGTAKNQKRIRQINRELNKLQGDYGSVQDTLTELKRMYAELISANEGKVAQIYDEGVEGFLADALEAIGDTEYSDLSVQQLQALNDAYAAILHRIRTANNTFSYGQKEAIDQLAKRAGGEFAAQKDREKLTGENASMLEKFSWNNLKPVYAFERMGSATMTALYNNLRNGEDTFYRDVVDARAWALECMEEFGYGKWEDQLIEYESVDGKKFSLNLEERMSLYAYSRRRQAIEHLMKGGIVLNESTKRVVKNKLGIKTERLLHDYTNYRLSLETIQAIGQSLTEQQKGFAEKMQSYLSTVCADKNNEVSRALYGVSKAKEKYYWPLKSSNLFSERVRNQQENSGNRQKNAGHMKDTTPHANNPVEVSGFMDTWGNHVNNTAMYHAFTLPMEDFLRVYNFNNTAGATEESIVQLITKKHGKGATEYIDQFLKDLNKGARSDPREGIANALTSKFKKGAVSASLSVAIQQPSAVGRAFAVIDPKYFRITDMKYYGTSLLGKKAQKTQARWEEMKQYAPVVGIKEMGRFDVNMGRSTVDLITGAGETGFMAKVDELSGYLPEKMDQATWMMIYNAAERQCKAQGYTGENLKTATAKLFTEAITKTQVYDSVFSRSGNMRSKSLFMNMATSFLAEPTTTANMFMDAWTDAKQGNWKSAGRKWSSIAAATVFNAMLASFVYAARDDDEDKPYKEKLLKSFTSEMVDSFNPMGYVPIVKDIWSLFQGYDVDRADMTLWSEAANHLNRLKSAYEAMAELDEEDADYEENLAAAQKKVAESWGNAAGALCNMTGLPVKNVLREIRAIVNTWETVDDDREADWDTAKYAMWEALQENLPELIRDKDSKADELYKAMTSGSQVWVNRMRDSYSSDKAYENAVRGSLRDHDKRIRQAAKALNNNADSTEYKQIVNAILSEGHFTQEQVEKAIQAEAKSISGSLSGHSTQSIEKFIDLYEDDLLDAEQYTAFLEYRDAEGEDGKKIHHKDEMIVYIGSMKVNAKAKDTLYNLMDYDEKDLEKMPWHTSGYSLWEARVEIPELADYSDSAVETFLEIRNSQITAKVFTNAYEYRHAKDSEGKQLHTPAEIMAYIDSLSLSRENKDELYLAMGYKETTLNKTPWN